MLNTFLSVYAKLFVVKGRKTTPEKLSIRRRFMLYDTNEVIIELLQRILDKLGDIALSLDLIESATSSLDIKTGY